MLNMTDIELCEAISSKRELKPELLMAQDSTNPISGNECWEFVPFGNNGIWRPLNWLSWEYAGKLLEEIVDAGCGILFGADASTKYIRIINHAGNVICSTEGSDFPHVIAEAWLEVNK